MVRINADGSQYLMNEADIDVLASKLLKQALPKIQESLKTERLVGWKKIGEYIGVKTWNTINKLITTEALPVELGKPMTAEKHKLDEWKAKKIAV